AIFCSILWGSAFPVLKISYEEMQMAANDPIAKIVLAGMRFLLAGLMLLAGMLLFNKRSLVVTKRQVRFLVLFVIVQTALQYFFFYNGVANPFVMHGAILSSFGRFFYFIFAYFAYHTHLINC